MLKVGDVAPPLEGRTADGRVVSLEALRGKPVVVYFFPKAFTPVCTVETKGFRDNYEDLKQYGFEVIGVSTDAPDTQCRFAEAHGVAYPMLGDSDKKVTRAYGVLWPLLPVARRVTYVLDERHVVVAVFHHEFQANKHLDDVIRFAKSHRGRNT